MYTKSQLIKITGIIFFDSHDIIIHQIRNFEIYIFVKSLLIIIIMNIFFDNFMSIN